jgi:ankyrin repeat protein
VGADVNYSVNLSDNKSPLILAIQEGHFDVVKLLIEAGANVNQLLCGDFALLTAAACGYEEIFNYLAPLTESKLRQEAAEVLPEGIRQRQREESAEPLVSSLSSAVFENNVDEVKEILAKGVNVNGFNENGWTALLRAASKRNISLVQLLLEAGADPNLGDDDRNQTPLMVAIGSSEQSRSVCSLLIAAGANVNAQTTDGMTPLMLAAQFGNLEITEMLIQFGTDVSL